MRRERREHNTEARRNGDARREQAVGPPAFGRLRPAGRNAERSRIQEALANPCLLLSASPVVSCRAQRGAHGLVIQTKCVFSVRLRSSVPPC